MLSAAAVTLRSTSPSFAYGARVGFSRLFIRSLSLLSTEDSPTLNICIVLETNVLPVYFLRIGASSLSNIGRISLGGPGRSARNLPLFSASIPGAVPKPFLSITAPFGIRACFRLFSVIVRLIFLKYSSVHFS